MKGAVSPGRITFKAQITLPSALGGATAGAGFSAVDGSGLRLDTLKVTVKRIKVGAALRVEDIGLTYTRSSDEWASKATVYLPGPKAPTVSARLKLRGGTFKSLSADVNGINRPIAVGVFLQSIGFGVAISPFTLDGRMTLTGGPRVLGVAAATAKGKMRYRSNAYSISGELKLVKATLATALLRYATPSSITMEGLSTSASAAFRRVIPDEGLARRPPRVPDRRDREDRRSRSGRQRQRDPLQPRHGRLRHRSVRHSDRLPLPLGRQGPAARLRSRRGASARSTDR